MTALGAALALWAVLGFVERQLHRRDELRKHEEQKAPFVTQVELLAMRAVFADLKSQVADTRNALALRLH